MTNVMLENRRKRRREEEKETESNDAAAGDMYVMLWGLALDPARKPISLNKPSKQKKEQGRFPC